jgi:hypothetical protein
VAQEAHDVVDAARANAALIMRRLPHVVEAIDFEQTGTTAVIGIRDVECRKPALNERDRDVRPGFEDSVPLAARHGPPRASFAAWGSGLGARNLPTAQASKLSRLAPRECRRKGCDVLSVLPD